jgi:hypothetical protein
MIDPTFKSVRETGKGATDEILPSLLISERRLFYGQNKGVEMKLEQRKDLLACAT